MELECHLDQFPSSKSLTKSLLLNLRKRFSVLLEPTDQNFNPIPSAACLLDPTCASVILSFDTSAIREKAKTYILTQVIIILFLDFHLEDDMRVIIICGPAVTVVIIIIIIINFVPKKGTVLHK